MARLEQGVEPLITPMIRGEHIGIGRDGRAVISAWAIKTAMVVEYAEKPDKRYFTQSERSLIMHNFVPSGTGIRIWIGRYQGSFNGAIGSASFLLVPRTDGVTDSAHTLTLAVGQFVTQVFAERLTAHHSEVLNVRDGPWQETLIPIWPPKPATDEVALIWPPPLALTDDTFAALGDRFVGVDS